MYVHHCFCVGVHSLFVSGVVDQVLMAPRVHPCVCGFLCDTYGQMKRHRSTCDPWQMRPNPEQLMAARQSKTHRSMRRTQKSVAEICPECSQRADHHAANCFYSQVEVSRRTALEKHGIDPRAFAVVLKLLKRRYESRFKSN